MGWAIWGVVKSLDRRITEALNQTGLAGVVITLTPGLQAPGSRPPLELPSRRDRPLISECSATKI